MDIAVSPRKLAVIEIKQYFKKLGIKSIVRSGMKTAKMIYIDVVDGVEKANVKKERVPYISITHDEFPKSDINNIKAFIESIQIKHMIKIVSLKERIPF